LELVSVAAEVAGGSAGAVAETVSPVAVASATRWDSPMASAPGIETAAAFDAAAGVAGLVVAAARRPRMARTSGMAGFALTNFSHSPTPPPTTISATAMAMAASSGPRDRFSTAGSLAVAGSGGGTSRPTAPLAASHPWPTGRLTPLLFVVFAGRPR
jgi:hypothetical protein